MTRTTRYITAFEFGQSDTFTLSDTSKITSQGGVVRLAKVRNAVKLPGRPIASFSLDDDIYARTRLFLPGVLRTFDFVEVLGNTPVDENQAEVTSYAFRGFDGTDSKYWDGAAWSVAGAGDWNTLFDFNANLATFGSPQIAFEVRLKTTDERFTPTMTSICVRWTGDVFNSYKEWIYRAVVQSLKANIRPLTNFTTASDGTVTVDISSYFDAGFDMVSMVSAYDHTADPTHSTDILSSFDSNTKIVTLTSAPASGNNVWLTGAYKPDVAVTTSVDFVTDAKLPALWITSVTAPRKQTQLGQKGPSIVDRSLAVPEGTAFPLPIPLVDLDFTIAALSPTALDLLPLTQAFSGWMQTHPLLRSPALDDEVTLVDGLPFGWATDNADADDTRVTLAGFSLLNVPILHDPATGGASDGVGSAPVDGVKGIKKVVFNWQPADGGDEITQTE